LALTVKFGKSCPAYDSTAPVTNGNMELSTDDPPSLAKAAPEPRRFSYFCTNITLVVL